ncbi:MAG TPA: hypothetical protein VEJ20_08375 [Candidatus Eremiobacteraceae bacterium]|nr:hypothetical protein [Candidatus Eremiobacteraceae bacterium]
MDNQGPAKPASPVPVAPQPAAAGAGGAAPSIGERIHDFEMHLPTMNEAFSAVVQYIPGFAGYKSTEDRRIADKELRTVIGERLTKVKGRLDDVVDSLTRSGSLDGVALIDQSGRRLARLIDRMRFADYGYAAIFDRVQINDAELARIYQYDAAILGELGKFDDAVSEVEMASTDAARLRSALIKLDALTAEFDRRFEGRKHLFDGLPAP